MSKADNMLSILWLLKTRKRITAKQLAEELEINIRTVYRYIDALCASGVPIIADSGHNGGYSLLGQFNEAPLFFDINEQKALIHAAVFAEEAGYPFGEALNRAIGKLKKYTNEEQLHQINRHTVGFDVINPPSDGSLETFLQELELSVANGATLLMDYMKANPPSEQREIDPYGIVYWKGKWYIVAYCYLRREIRSFRVDRIRSLSRTGAAFERPVDFSARQFFLNTLLPDMDNPETMLSIRVEGYEQAINDLCLHWLLGHVLVERTATTAHFQLDERSIVSYLPYTLLSYGKSIRIIEPAMLKERMVAISSALVQHYESM
ncbi:helix-turn-helix transcriptional regulator [Paenibacillus sp. NPDC056579]|uniref:helix-turn-helix transcriptional regulator n=1 Tax=unclassified Paenibacillus TaxID=185978 RepID=UPI001EF82077|nr:WYL domain-containing protein [Paenibacillus sp. H1-7]ULL13500.1 WYL domain-containing protein [Paenibacillus sp. H1-7]